MTYDRAVYRVTVETEDYVHTGGFEGLIRQTDEVGPDDTSAELLEIKADEKLTEYLVVVHADASVHPVIQERFGSFADGLAGVKTRVESADVTVGVDKPEA